jgi:hypothetical protein
MFCAARLRLRHLQMQCMAPINCELYVGTAVNVTLFSLLQAPKPQQHAYIPVTDAG